MSEKSQQAAFVAALSVALCVLTPLMPKAKRNIGQEILEGIRQLKRGEHGTVMKVPLVTAIREKTGLSQPRVAELLGVSVAPRTGAGPSGVLGCRPNTTADRREEPARISTSPSPDLRWGNAFDRRGALAAPTPLEGPIHAWCAQIGVVLSGGSIDVSQIPDRRMPIA
jgi:hypothetical protein